MAWIDKYFAGYTTIQSNGAPLPQRSILNFPNATIADNAANLSTDVTPGVTFPLTNPTVQGTSDYFPTAAQIATFGISGGRVKQAFWGGSGSATVGFFPLPGQVGAPITAGGIHVDVLHKMSGTTGGSGVGATFKSSASWQVTALGVVAAEQTTASQPVATGTNGGSPPAGWSSTLQLNSGSTSVEVVVVGGSSDSLVMAQAIYCQ
jgi:hypothetical protein